MAVLHPTHVFQRRALSPPESFAPHPVKQSSNSVSQVPSAANGQTFIARAIKCQREITADPKELSVLANVGLRGRGPFLPSGIGPVSHAQRGTGKGTQLKGMQMSHKASTPAANTLCVALLAILFKSRQSWKGRGCQRVSVTKLGYPRGLDSVSRHSRSLEVG